MVIRRISRVIRLTAIAVLAILLLSPEWSAIASEESQLQSIIGMRQYDFLVWESNAFLNKGETVLAAGQTYLDEETRKAVVLDYLKLVHQAQLLEDELNRAFGDPEILDPALVTQDLQNELNSTRAAIDAQQLLAEAILQEQTATILTEEGFEVMSWTWPPVLMHVTQLPALLVVSPRDRIEKLHQVPLVHGLSTPDKEDIESAIFDDLDRSAIIVPLGGIGTFPAMIVETSNINILADVVAHEWVHHWLTLQPLGLNYAFDPNVRIINETVASLVDQELGNRLVERYYPEYLPPPVEEGKIDQIQAPDSPEFDFQTELANTRIKTDELLAEGRIEEAEAYMESRRLEFREQGHHIRKLNQAYFAFYGAYAAEPGGAQGGNPIGPMLRDIRTHTPTVKAFLDAVAPITSFEDLKEVHGRIVPPSFPNSLDPKIKSPTP